MNALATSRAASGPLVGVRVLDFGSYIAGPYGAAVLGDLGADVIKIESVGGDLARHWGPFLRGESRLFQGYNRNKRSVAVDLRAPAGRDVAHALARTADVVIENMRPGITARLGVDWPTLRALNPRLIYVSSTAFGSRGPYRDRPGFDPLLQSMSGAASANARLFGVPAHICSVAVSDYQAGMLVALAVSAALYHRANTGEGQHIETSLLQAAMSVQSASYVQPLECEEVGAAGIYPYHMFATADGQVFLAIGNDKFWELLAEALGRSDLATDPRYAKNGDRVSRAAELDAILEPLLKSSRPATGSTCWSPPAFPAPRCRTARRSSTIRRSRRWAWRRRSSTRASGRCGSTACRSSSRARPARSSARRRCSASTPPRSWASWATARTASRSWRATV